MRTSLTSHMRTPLTPSHRYAHTSTATHDAMHAEPTSSHSSHLPPSMRRMATARGEAEAQARSAAVAPGPSLLLLLLLLWLSV